MFPTIKIGDKIYQTGSNWFTAGFGYGYATNLRENQINLSLNYHRRYKAMYFNLGYHHSADKFFLDRPMIRLNDVHTGAGLRFEFIPFNFGFFIGPSWSFGILHDRTDEYGRVFYTAFHTLGAFTELQFTWKFFYDLGIGTSLYGSFNKHYQVVGAQLHFYFSSAYKAKY
ncbi:MAG: hypothetical protein GX879_04740 [Bacteroidales bacterium]|nr:hypothetical protein [Bacteroidales bacterium]